MKAILRRSVVAVAVAALISAACPAAHPVVAHVAAEPRVAAAQVPDGVLVLGAGSRPTVAVNAAGTGFIAWVGPEASETSLQFCRILRGAGGCASSPRPT